MRRQLGMIESQRRPPADAQIHVARGEPFSALLRLGEIGPDAFGRAGQQAFEANGLPINDFAVLLIYIWFRARRPKRSEARMGWVSMASVEAHISGEAPTSVGRCRR